MKTVSIGAPSDRTPDAREIFVMVTACSIGNDANDIGIKTYQEDRRTSTHTNGVDEVENAQNRGVMNLSLRPPHSQPSWTTNITSLGSMCLGKVAAMVDTT